MGSASSRTLRVRRRDRSRRTGACVPDLVFTANSAVVLDRVALLARFRYPERRREERHFEAAFRALQARGLIDAVGKLPDDLVLEGR
jgi:N-dimethylarginine dimethylaminohydrolase